MEKPALSWIPVRLLDQILRMELSLKDWLKNANRLALPAVEIYAALLPNNYENLRSIVSVLKELNLKVSLLTCSPDFAHPDANVRKKQFEDMKSKVNIAQAVQAFGIRVTTGMRHPEVKEGDAILWIVEKIAVLAEYGQSQGIAVCLENHYRDKYQWKYPDFAYRTEVFLKIFERLKNTAVMINFDTSNQLMNGEDPLVVLRKVKDKVVSIHASDRLSGEYQHTVIGDGDVDYDATFEILKDTGFDGWISIEDGNPYGDEGFKRSLAFMRGKIRKYWG